MENSLGHLFSAWQLGIHNFNKHRRFVVRVEQGKRRLPCRHGNTHVVSLYLIHDDSSAPDVGRDLQIFLEAVLRGYVRPD
ncbi:unnamed protein product [Leptidea sinapis]|uniref:Uncharacterized protein n=1 Tax=Leptidea sinapis TaxID=189913 RepID=A0A5E4Q8I0_9NEOP|nr:unnamed protein product [Leptidea sinapis]